MPFAEANYSAGEPILAPRAQPDEIPLLDLGVGLRADGRFPRIAASALQRLWRWKADRCARVRRRVCTPGLALGLSNSPAPLLTCAPILLDARMLAQPALTVVGMSYEPLLSEHSFIADDDQAKCALGSAFQFNVTYGTFVGRFDVASSAAASLRLSSWLSLPRA
jgi:hypothetical protein